MGAEDFGVHLAAIPGAFAFLGARPHTGDPYPWHHVQCVFDGRALVVGVSVRTSVTVGYLAPGRAAPAPD